MTNNAAMTSNGTIVRPARLQPGDHVRMVSPASTPARVDVEGSARFLEGLGLSVSVGEHAYDELGYLAGTDEHRLGDLNAALRDPGIKAIIATRGGKGAYRIADGMDFDAAARHPKLLIGFSEITILHLALQKHCGLAGLHGAPFEESWSGVDSARSFLTAAFTTDPVTVRSDSHEDTAQLTTTGRAGGRLIGGNQDMVATAAGWTLPSLDGAILLLEAYNMRLGHIDRQLTMLHKSGRLAGVRGVAVGQYTECGSDAETHGDWTAIDVLRDRLGLLGVPILGGLPVGHGAGPIALPLGTMATLDADAGTLSVEAAVG